MVSVLQTLARMQGRPPGSNLDPELNARLRELLREEEARGNPSWSSIYEAALERLLDEERRKAMVTPVKAPDPSTSGTPAPAYTTWSPAYTTWSTSYTALSMRFWDYTFEFADGNVVHEAVFLVGKQPPRTQRFNDRDFKLKAASSRRRRARFVEVVRKPRPPKYQLAGELDGVKLYTKGEPGKVTQALLEGLETWLKDNRGKDPAGEVG